VTLPETMNAAALLTEVMTRGVIFVPGETFHPDGTGANTLRLNFVSASPDAIETGIRHLAAAVRDGLTGNLKEPL